MHKGPMSSSGSRSPRSPKRQALLEKLNAKPSPRSSSRLDLAADPDKMKAEYEVVVGDWNVRHPDGTQHPQAAGKRNTAVVRRFAQSRGLVDPLKKRLGKDEVEPRTYSSGGNETWIDYYLVS